MLALAAQWPPPKCVLLFTVPDSVFCTFNVKKQKTSNAEPANWVHSPRHSHISDQMYHEVDEDDTPQHLWLYHYAHHEHCKLDCESTKSTPNRLRGRDTHSYSYPVRVHSQVRWSDGDRFRDKWVSTSNTFLIRFKLWFFFDIINY